jgi:WD40 repeat protein
MCLVGEKCTGTSVAFDYSASFLAIGVAGATNGVRVVSTGKEWSDITSIACHTKAVTAVAWGNHTSTQLISASMDRTVKTYNCVSK